MSTSENIELSDEELAELRVETDETDALIGINVGNYVVRKRVGVGGMGSVYLAEHPVIGKKVAVKVLHTEYASNKDLVQRFFNEAKAVTEIQHPNIVDVIDYGFVPNERTGGERVYFVMEYLEGKTLSQMLQAKKRLDENEARMIALQIADALRASHQKGIIHRDLKPDNIVVRKRPNGRMTVKILDFGIAKLVGDDRTEQTQQGVVMGTPSYMSPEQCEGQGDIDHRSDVYSLGVVLFKMVTGKVPFSGQRYSDVLVQHLTKPPPKPSSFVRISSHVEVLILKMLQKRKSRRLPSMGEVVQALKDPRAYVEGSGGVTRFLDAKIEPNAEMSETFGPSETFVPTKPSLFSRKMWVGAALALGGILIGVLFSQALGGGPESDAAPANVVSAEDTDAAEVATVLPDAPPKPQKVDAPKKVAVAAPNDAPLVTRTFSVTSLPVAAMVYVKGESMPRGRTPLDVPIGDFKEDAVIVLKKRGYKSRSMTLTKDSDVRVRVELEKEKKTPIITGPLNP